MDVKWFFVIVGIFLTFAILIGMYFIGTFIVLQQQQTQQESSQRFENSTMIHQFLFKNITDLKKGMDPILAIIPNATQAEIDRQIHYNQTAEDFKRIQQVLEIKLQDHITLIQVNNTVNQIADFLFNQTTNTGNGSVIVIDNTTKPVPEPIIVNDTDDNNNRDKNETGGIIVENITGNN